MSPSHQSSGVDPPSASLFCIPVQSMSSLLLSKVEEIYTRACLYDFVFVKTGLFMFDCPLDLDLVTYVSILSATHKFNLLHTAYHLSLYITEILTITLDEKTKKVFLVLVQHTLTSNLSLVYIKTQNINHLKQTGMERSFIGLYFTVCPIIQHCFISVISWFSPQFLEIISKSLSRSLYSRSLVKDLVQWHKARNLP